MWCSMVVQATESTGTLREKHETNLFVDGGKGVKFIKWNTGKWREICQSENVGTMLWSVNSPPGQMLDHRNFFISCTWNTVFIWIEAPGATTKFWADASF